MSFEMTFIENLTNCNFLFTVGSTVHIQLFLYIQNNEVLYCQTNDNQSPMTCEPTIINHNNQAILTCPTSIVVSANIHRLFHRQKEKLSSDIIYNYS